MAAAAERTLQQLVNQEHEFHDDAKQGSRTKALHHSDQGEIDNSSEGVNDYKTYYDDGHVDDNYQRRHPGEERDVNTHAQSHAHNAVWRKMIVQWCYNVVDHIQVDREIVYVTINILDRFLATQERTKSQATSAQVSEPCPSSPLSPPSHGRDSTNGTNTCTQSHSHSHNCRKYLTNRRDYEAAVMTSLLITLKLQGISSSVLSVHDLIKMSRHAVTAADILSTGKDIVRSLTWNKRLPTAARFVHVLVDLFTHMHADVHSSVATLDRQALFDESIFLIELTVQEERCSTERPSLVAWMAFENALDSIGLHLDNLEEIRSSFRTTVARVLELDYDVSVPLYRLIRSLYNKSSSIRSGNSNSNTSGYNQRNSDWINHHYRRLNNNHSSENDHNNQHPIDNNNNNNNNNDDGERSSQAVSVIIPPDDDHVDDVVRRTEDVNDHDYYRQFSALNTTNTRTNSRSRSRPISCSSNVVSVEDMSELSYFCRCTTSTAASSSQSSSASNPRTVPQKMMKTTMKTKTKILGKRMYEEDSTQNERWCASLPRTKRFRAFGHHQGDNQVINQTI